jgi:hypothetical protein
LLGAFVGPTVRKHTPRACLAVGRHDLPLTIAAVEHAAAEGED